MIIFGVMAHTDPVLLKRLLARLDPYRTLVHVDAASAESRELEECVLGSTNASLTSSRVSVNWAGWTQVEAMLAVFRDSLLVATDDCDKVVLLSGNCYPLKDVGRIASYVESVKEHCIVGGMLSR